MLSKIKHKPVVMCIIDGWGIAPDSSYNAISLANTPCWDNLLVKFPYCKLQASGKEVGLPNDQIGNSEVGHMTIGSGRVILQDLERINRNIDKLENNKNINKLVLDINNKGGVCHLIGMASDGGVHGHINHLITMIKFLANKKIPLCLHLILDGRDVAPNSAIKFIKIIQNIIQDYKELINIGSISGRYYAMDRDNRWDRTLLAYNAIFNTDAKETSDFISEIELNYSNNITDEFIKPIVNKGFKGVKDGDSLIITNYRADRIKQIANLIAGNKQDLVSNNISLLNKLSMVEYSKSLGKFFDCIFKPETINNTIGELLSKNNKKQLRLAETEKYAHVTYFFNAGQEEPFYNEDRVLIPSPKVAFYNDVPKMSIDLVVQKLGQAISNKDYNFIVCNFANTDMLGHTGDLNATIKAVEAIDNALEIIVKTVLDNDWNLIITSDHGNCEQMKEHNIDIIKTSHTLNPVPFLLINKDISKNDIVLSDGGLKDIAPTILDILDIKKPIEMKGNSLIK